MGFIRLKGEFDSLSHYTTVLVQLPVRFGWPRDRDTGKELFPQTPEKGLSEARGDTRMIDQGVCSGMAFQRRKGP